jgi:hypothetical protein
MKKTLAALILLILCFPTSAKAVDTSVPNVKFIWDVKGGALFTNEEIRKLAGFDIVVIDTPNGPVPISIKSTEDEARQIIAINPKVKVIPNFSLSKGRLLLFGYFNTNKVFIDTPEADFWAEGYKESYFMHNPAGQRIVATGYGGQKGKPAGFYNDYSNINFRSWALQIFHNWMNDAPFAGIAFDEADPIEVRGQDTAALSYLTAAQKAAWDTGQGQLLTAFKNQFPTKIAVYNSMSNNYDRFFGTADMELEENFCYDGGTLTKTAQLTNLDHQIKTSGLPGTKAMLEQVNMGDDTLSPAATNTIGRYCYGIFLLGWLPGRSYFWYVHPGLPYIDSNALEINLPLGVPTTPKYLTTINGMFYRNFTNASVYVNMETSPKTITITQPLTLMNGGVAGASYVKGQTVSIPAQDAYFFLKSQPGITITPTPTPASIPGDLTDYEDVAGDQVNIWDYNILMQDFGRTGAPGFIPDDMTGEHGVPNGVIDIFDYNELLGNFSK